MYVCVGGGHRFFRDTMWTLLVLRTAMAGHLTSLVFGVVAGCVSNVLGTHTRSLTVRLQLQLAAFPFSHSSTSRLSNVYGWEDCWCGGSGVRSGLDEALERVEGLQLRLFSHSPLLTDWCYLIVCRHRSENFPTLGSKNVETYKYLIKRWCFRIDYKFF